MNLNWTWNTGLTFIFIQSKGNVLTHFKDMIRSALIFFFSLFSPSFLLFWLVFLFFFFPSFDWTFMRAEKEEGYWCSFWLEDLNRMERYGANIFTYVWKRKIGVLQNGMALNSIGCVVFCFFVCFFGCKILVKNKIVK